jgi:ribosomal protein L11 methyltransferase
VVNSLEFEAGRAFGTGAHPSTIGALSALGGLAGSITPQIILDIGCGSGVLSLAAAHYWPDAQIMATDTMQEAVATTRHNAEKQGWGGRIHAVRADGVRHEDISRAGPYDLIICNIVAAPVIMLADDIAAHLAEGGAAILSGILVWRQWQVEEAYALHGLTPVDVLEVGEWRTLIMAKLSKPCAP